MYLHYNLKWCAEADLRREDGTWSASAESLVAATHPPSTRTRKAGGLTVEPHLRLRRPGHLYGQYMIARG